MVYLKTILNFEFQLIEFLVLTYIIGVFIDGYFIFTTYLKKW